jgi:hypothetical protein
VAGVGEQGDAARDEAAHHLEHGETGRQGEDDAEGPRVGGAPGRSVIV